jgi:RNA polymerase sigma-70 factor (ECF subfamily)
LNHLRRNIIETTSIDELPPTADSNLVDSFMQKPDDHRVELLQRAIRRLTDDDQLLVTLFYYEGMSLTDIAYIIAQTPNALGVRLYRIRQKLYNMIKQDAL